MGGVDREHDRPFLRARLRSDERYRLELREARAYGVPHSVFTGRVVGPGEPLFLAEDADGAIALAEEERDTCQSCGMPKVWCRDPANQFAFDAQEEFCWVTYRLADARRGKGAQMGDSQREALQLSARFRDGIEPDVEAGLGLEQLGEQKDNPK